MVQKIDQYLKRLFPINRSITGPGNRKTLRILQEIIPLKIKEYTSGTRVYDWVIPDEWRVRDAWIKDARGNKLVDFKQSNIHLVNYSEPIKKSFTFEELKPHLHQHKELPDAVPYLTTYYKRNWGFCVNQAQYKTLQEANSPFDVLIDSEFDPKGNLTIGELLIPGKTKEEILISTYICHPSLANDNLSGMLMTAFLAQELLKEKNHKRGYRIIWVPETIGAITYCAMHEAEMKRINSGLVVTTVGGPGKFGYKKSYNSNHSVNAIIEMVFKQEEVDFITYPFDIHGSDERQYSAQGFGINVASITKDKYYEYPHYHTSLDNLDFVKSEYIVKSLKLHLKVLYKLNQEAVYRNCIPNCEVMLSKHNLYPQIGGGQRPNSVKNKLDTILWLLWKCDGYNGIYGIAKQLNIPSSNLLEIIKELEQKEILNKVI